MATTTSKAYRYPGNGDPPAGFTQIQELAEDVDKVGLVGGKRRTAASAGITTTETIVVDTASLTLAASSSFVLRFYARFDTTVAVSDCTFKIRDTNVSGTIRGEANAAGPYTTANYGFIEVPYKTTTAETKVFVGTLIRKSGTGSITAQVPTYLAVYREGPSALIGDF